MHNPVCLPLELSCNAPMYISTILFMSNLTIRRLHEYYNFKTENTYKFL